MDQDTFNPDLPSGENATPENTAPEAYDYAFVSTVARIARYDDLMSAPHVTEIPPAETGHYIESLASQVYEQARKSGGSIPYTVVREVSENFIHARFQEVIVSILDNGNTIRFADQGPGIAKKDRVQTPGFSSAIDPMKHYIRGVGSGLPLVKEYLSLSHGTITIEDNIGAGSVVTISLNPERAAEQHVSRETFGGATLDAAEPAATNAARVAPAAGMGVAASAYVPAASAPAAAAGTAFGFGEQNVSRETFPPAMSNAFGGDMPAGVPLTTAPGGYQSFAAQPAPATGYAPQFAGTPAGSPYMTAEFAAHEARRLQATASSLSERERAFLIALSQEGPLGVTDLSNTFGVATSSTYKALKTLEDMNLVDKIDKGKQRILTPLGEQIARNL